MAPTHFSLLIQDGNPSITIIAPCRGLQVRILSVSKHSVVHRKMISVHKGKPIVQVVTARKDGQFKRFKERKSMKKNLRLYVWENVLGNGIAFAYAENSEEARQLIIEKLSYTHEDLCALPREITESEGFYASGD